MKYEIYSNNDFSEVSHTMGDHERTIHDVYDDISMKTIIILSRFGLTFGTLSFDGKSFFNTSLGFVLYWDNKTTNAFHVDSPGIYNNEKITKLSTIYKVHLKCDCIDGSLVNSLRQPILYSFVLDKPRGYKVFCESEAIHYKKNKQICFEHNSILFGR